MSNTFANLTNQIDYLGLALKHSRLKVSNHQENTLNKLQIAKAVT